MPCVRGERSCPRSPGRSRGPSLWLWVLRLCLCCAPCFDHLLVVDPDRVDRGSHAFSKGTGMEDLRGGLTADATVPVHIVDPVRAVVEAHGGLNSIVVDREDHGIVDDLSAQDRKSVV